ncbi:MAG: type II toxin-antitoxin system mRNA interferase toxin, RelE/StbE family [Patescibacteria group bacterium]|nr:type II toxin-antitoxin system mRNA interferase toxin, RelE/StbE family [Patescibacteria group bacterium]
MTIVTSNRFDKAVNKLPPKVVAMLKMRVQLFMINPFSVELNNHQLHGYLRNYKSINITGDYRLIYEQYDDDTVRFINIGRHRELYR